jgi:hypothetical protein
MRTKASNPVEYSQMQKFVKLVESHYCIVYDATMFLSILGDMPAHQRLRRNMLNG